MKYEIIDSKQKKVDKIVKEIARDVGFGLNNQNPIKSKLKIKKTNEKTDEKTEYSSDIEKSVSAVNFMTTNHLEYEAIKIKKGQAKLYTILRDCPIFGDALQTKIMLSRHIDAWITDQIKEVHKESQKAVVNELMSKKVKRAIEKLQKVGGFGGGDNW
jgi:hypothetical protein